MTCGELRTAGMVFDIQHFSLDNGPGIRTAVFLKGCPLRCAWCHNPEGQSRRPELLLYRDKCTLCSSCAAVCPWQCHVFEKGRHIFRRKSCRGCGRCTSACLTEALRLAGSSITVAEVMEALSCDRPFYGNDGGITLTGGEPLAQPDFTLALLQTAKRQKLHTCLETSGYGEAGILTALLPYTDLILYDIKETDPHRHKALTGVELAPILDNLRQLARAGAALVLRCPLIENGNLREEHALALARLADSMPTLLGIDIEPYHPFGLSKYTALEKACAYPEDRCLPRSHAEDFCSFLQSHTRTPVHLV